MPAVSIPPQNDPGDKEFRRKNLWYSFTSAMYGVVGGAALFGMATQLAGMAFSAAAGNAQALATLINPIALTVAAGMAVVGVAATYLSQRELTEQKVIQDEHLARMNAQQLNQGRTLSIPERAVQADEYPNNCRADGKPWESVIQCEQSHIKMR